MFGRTLIAASALSLIAGTPVFAQSVHDRDVAVIPYVPTAVILETFAESCQTAGGRILEQTDEYLVCDATNYVYSPRSRNIVKMYFEARDGGWSIKTNSQIDMGNGVVAWTRMPSNFQMDMHLARQVLEKQATHS